MRILLLLFIILTAFACKRQASDQSLFGSWKVSSLLKDGTSIVQNTNDTLIITFSNNKTVSVKLEINSCSGNFTLTDNTLEINPLLCTLACCDSEFSSDLLYTLQRIDSYHFSGEDLTLAGDSDRVIRCSPH